MTTVAPALAEITGTYTIDPTHTRIGIVSRYAMVTKVRGAFNEFEGAAVLDGADPSRSTASVTIQAASIDTRNAQRDEHLRNNDFLATDEFPTITFVSVTIPFSYEGGATDPFGNVRAGFEGSVAVSRKDFGITWNAALQTGGVLLGDKIVLEFEVSAIRNASD